MIYDLWRPTKNISFGAFMDVFQLRNTIVDDYGQFIRSFHQIKDQRIRLKVESADEKLAEHFALSDRLRTELGLQPIEESTE